VVPESGLVRAEPRQKHEDIYDPGIFVENPHMFTLILYTVFYVFGLAMARVLSPPQKAAVLGGATIVAAALASFTLWVLSRTGHIDIWMTVAMVGSITLPAALIGLGLVLGAWFRLARNRLLAGTTIAAPLLAFAATFVF
jgi:hypothetical protein